MLYAQSLWTANLRTEVRAQTLKDSGGRADETVNSPENGDTASHLHETKTSERASKQTNTQQSMCYNPSTWEVESEGSEIHDCLCLQV